MRSAIALKAGDKMMVALRGREVVLTVERVNGSKKSSRRILKYLQAGNAITPLESLERFGCFRLGARIYDLRKEGHEIQREMVTTPQGKHVASYKLVEKPNGT